MGAIGTLSVITFFSGTDRFKEKEKSSVAPNYKADNESKAANQTEPNKLCKAIKRNCNSTMCIHSALHLRLFSRTKSVQCSSSTVTRNIMVIH